MRSSCHELHSRAVALAEAYRQNEILLLEVLIEMDRYRAYLELGYSSLFKYCVEALGLSEAQSYGLMSIARKSASVPEIKIAIEQKELSISNARKIVSVITPANKNVWLEKAKSLSQRELEKEIVKEGPKKDIDIRGLDPETQNDLKRAKEILGEGNNQAALKKILKDFLKRNDPVEKAKRQLGVRPVARPRKSSRYIPRKVFHEVQRRDLGGCQFKSAGGKVCGERFGVETHHLEPWGYGGKHQPENLLTLCRAHHAYRHRATA